jgi:hypothetical protein
MPLRSAPQPTNAGGATRSSPSSGHAAARSPTRPTSAARRGDDGATAIALGAHGEAYVTGPLGSGALAGSRAGSEDPPPPSAGAADPRAGAFVRRLSCSGRSIPYATAIGGTAASGGERHEHAAWRRRMRALDRAQRRAQAPLVLEGRSATQRERRERRVDRRKRTTTPSIRRAGASASATSNWMSDGPRRAAPPARADIPASASKVLSVDAAMPSRAADSTNARRVSSTGATGARPSLLVSATPGRASSYCRGRPMDE